VPAEHSAYNNGTSIVFKYLLSLHCCG